jgi:hypothetical protein
MFTVTAPTCAGRNGVCLSVYYETTQVLSGEMFGWIPAMRVHWTARCICSSFDMPVMLVALVHSCVSAADSCVRCCRSLDICELRWRGEICLSASKLDRHLLFGPFKNLLHMWDCGLEIGLPYVSKRALQLWKLIEIYTEDIHNVLNCQNVANHTEFYLG